MNGNKNIIDYYPIQKHTTNYYQLIMQKYKIKKRASDQPLYCRMGRVPVDTQNIMLPPRETRF